MNKDLLKNMLAINSNLHVQELEHPTKVIIIDDFFVEPYYNQLLKYFQNFLEHNVTKNNLKNFSYDLQDGDLGKNNPFRFFMSKDWIKFVSSNFNLNLNKYTNINLNYTYASEDEPSLKSKLEKIPINLHSVNDNEDYEVQLISEEVKPNSSLNKNIKIVNNVLILYYLNNEDKEIGGETGLYDGTSEENLCLEIKPKNNRLVLIEIKDEIYKNFFGARFSTSYLIQSMNINPWNFIYKNLEVINENRIKKDLPIFENIKDNSILYDIDISEDEDYQRLFGIITPEEFLRNQQFIKRFISRIKKKVLV